MIEVILPMATQAGAEDGYTCELRGHTDTVSATAFSNDGSLLATAGLDGAYHQLPASCCS